MKSLQDCFTLSNGIGIPGLGFGTWKIKGDDAVTAVENAIANGYRHVDTATVYENESPVGDALRNSGLPREALFITSKLWNNNKTFDQVLRAFDESMARLKLDILDLYLIHWPSVPGLDPDWERTNHEKWRAMERLYKDGRVRAIGVSNYLPHHLIPLMDHADILPMVNQLEIHPGFLQQETLAFCKKHHILPEAWSPLACGKVLDVPALKTIAEKHSKTTAQICLRWCLQNDVLPLTKTTSVARMIENSDLFNFSISNDDMDLINSLPPCGGACINPDERKF